MEMGLYMGMLGDGLHGIDHGIFQPTEFYQFYSVMACQVKPMALNRSLLDHEWKMEEAVFFFKYSVDWSLLLEVC